MDTTTVISSADQCISHPPTRHRFFDVFWELKILLWGLAFIAITCAALYAWTVRSL